MEWTIERLGNTVDLLGPGGVRIETSSFDRRKVMVDEDSVEKLGQSNGLFEDWRYRTWDYELSRGVGLQVLTSWDATKPNSERYYLTIYHMTWRAWWEVPGEFAEELYGLNQA
jgi:hypothetical protein